MAWFVEFLLSSSRLSLWKVFDSIKIEVKLRWVSLQHADVEIFAHRLLNCGHSGITPLKYGICRIGLSLFERYAKDASLVQGGNVFLMAIQSSKHGISTGSLEFCLMRR